MSATPDLERLLAERARRQRLTPSTRLDDPDDHEALLETIRRLAPVAPRAFVFPGTPPQLAPRVCFDDLPAAEELRRRGAIVKGRFGRGLIGYVATDDLPLYASAYRRPSDRLSPEARAVVELIAVEGPLPRSDIMALTEIPGRRLSAALIELQRCFVLTELQYETEWDNAWTLLESEYPEVASAPPRERALDEVIARLLDCLAVATLEQLRDRSGLTLRDLRSSLGRLVASGRAIESVIGGVAMWTGAEAAERAATAAQEPYVAVLQPNDPLVQAHRSELKRRFGRSGVLAYVQIDGRFAGAALGRWGIAPFDVQDVLLEPPHDADSTREQIIAGLRVFYPPPRHRILRYLDDPLDAPGDDRRGDEPGLEIRR